MNYLFIGGTKDGKLINIEDGVFNYKVTLEENTPSRFKTIVKYSPSEENYYKETILVGIDENICIFRHESLTTLRAVQMLLNNYTRI